MRWIHKNLFFCFNPTSKVQHWCSGIYLLQSSLRHGTEDQWKIEWDRRKALMMAGFTDGLLRSGSQNNKQVECSCDYVSGP